MKKLLTILVLVGVSFSRAQHPDPSVTELPLNGGGGSLPTDMSSEAPIASNVITPGEQAKSTESVCIILPDERKPMRSRSRSFFTAFREEMNSFALTLPDLSASWFGFSWYVRNPLRYKLSPGSTYEHQFGLSSGDWLLSVDGIGMTSLSRLDIAFQYPFGKNMSLCVRYNDLQYKLNIQAVGKLPWER